jgi:signal peptidase
MYPSLQRGDAILIEKLDDKQKDNIKKGDIVVFYEDDEIITHRVIEVEIQDKNMYIITKGDNNDVKDSTKHEKNDIIGIVRLRIPLLGYPSVEISDITNKE